MAWIILNDLCLEYKKISESFTLSSGIFHTNWMLFHCLNKSTVLRTNSLGRLGCVPSIMEPVVRCILAIHHWDLKRISANIKSPSHQYHIFWKPHDIETQYKFYIKCVTITCLNYPKHGSIDLRLWWLASFQRFYILIVTVSHYLG